MTEYVYAVHDFTPEHEDEIQFKAGERIQIVEKDDLYGDGWWQVSRSLHPILLYRPQNPGFSFYAQL